MNWTKLALMTFVAAGFTVTANADHIWINEFHYDDPGGDAGEFVEVAIRNPNGSGFTASDYAVEFYNGSNGDLYNTSATLDAFGTIATFPVAGSTDTITLYGELVTGIQNGGPDGIALVNVTTGTVESFLSYEGVFTADADNGGIAGGLGLTSTDIGVSEPGVGELTSLGAAGFGDDANGFSAASFALTEVQTPGLPNTGQTFGVVPEPSSVCLMLMAACGTGAAFMRRRLG